MRNRTLLYIPLIGLLIFAIAVLAVHYRQMPQRIGVIAREYVIPFDYNREVKAIRPEAEKEGLRVKDKFLSINGAPITSDESFLEAMQAAEKGAPLNIVVRRETVEGKTEQLDLKISPVQIKKDLNFYSSFVVGLLFTYFLPTLCIFLGFWVVFVRLHDYLAWLLLFLLLGVSSVGLEGYRDGTLVGNYTQIFFSVWPLAMLLFGIYFPERLSFDRKIPWAKWIFIVPLGFQIFASLLEILKTQTGFGLVDYLKPLMQIYGKIGMPLNLLSIGMFFMALGYKSGTLKNPDARRRLKLMVYGTSAAMLPSFAIILYRLVSGVKGSFFDIVPFWLALLALLLMPLFPLTLAYVIVVHRAMDVGVVIRQGLQYALAQNGVKVLQFASLVAVILGVIWIFRQSDEFDVASQIGFVAAGFAFLPLIDYAAKNLRVWIDKKFFREAYDAEQILSELSEDVRTMVETKPLLETVSMRISESLHVPQIALLLKNGKSFVPAHALGYENLPPVELSETDQTVEKLKNNEPLTIYADDRESWLNGANSKIEREKLEKLNAQLLLPLGAKDELSGIISLSPKRSEQPYTPNDLRLLKSVAAQTGLALENSRLTEAIAAEAAQKERLNRELEIAREVQERLFPQELPTVEGLDYFGACRPALGVGGDYYDFLELPDGKFGFAIGDISGKGIGASLMMASLQASLRGQTIHFKEELAEMMKHVNTLLYEASTTNRYATFFYAQYDPATYKLIYVNAGHNPPFLLRPKDGDFEVLKLEDGGAVVGMLPSMLVFYKQGEIILEKGDLLVGFTDGISEAMNPQEEEWGEDAMLEELKRVTDKSAEEILHHIVECADRFANGAKQHDDMTMIVLKVI